jgi:hypothetical protein
MRLHRKVWLWWGRWWAVQLYVYPHVSLGLHIDFKRPYIDLHLPLFTLSVGNNPVITNADERHRGACRGFLFGDEPVL